uniref:Uncharacterized protein n=1 Tax=Anguilla anguilla TaxID=7936 RepID=A0A0E9W0I7_ANGAN
MVLLYAKIEISLATGLSKMVSVDLSCLSVHGVDCWPRLLNENPDRVDAGSPAGLTEAQPCCFSKYNCLRSDLFNQVRPTENSGFLCSE